MKVLSWVFGVAALLGSGSYLFVYVYRWEWHRALLVGLLFVAALVTLSAALVLRRLDQLEERLCAPSNADGERRALERLRSAPVEAKPFPWLQSEALERTNIFIPVLLGGGVVASGVAWLIERVAGRSARAGVEQNLARDLGLIAFPSSALVPTVTEAFACDDGFGDHPGLRLLLGPPSRGADR